jgi:hypothetical protein
LGIIQNTNRPGLYTEKTKLLEIYKKNYKYQYLDREYYPIDDNIEHSLYVYDDGQDFLNLLDFDGSFYLIHPYENSIKRNILNKVIKVRLFNKDQEEKKNRIPITEYKYFLKSLIDRNLIIDLKADSLYLYNDDLIKTDRIFVKTELAKNIIELKTDFELENMNDSITLITASAMGCLNEVLEIKIFMDLLKNQNMILLSNLVNTDKKNMGSI